MDYLTDHIEKMMHENDKREIERQLDLFHVLPPVEGETRAERAERCQKFYGVSTYKEAINRATPRMRKKR